MNEESVVVLNSAFHIILFIICYIKYGKGNLATVLAFFYAISSLAGLAFYESPVYFLFFAANGTATIQSAIVLWLIDAFSILAFSNVHLYGVQKISGYSTKVLFITEKIIIVGLFIYLILALPISLRDYIKSSGNLEQARDSLYDASNVTARYSGILGFIYYKIQLYVFTAPFLLLSIISIRYFLLGIRNKWDNYGCILYLLSKLNLVLSNVSRATILFAIFELIIFYCLYYHFFSKNFKKKVLTYSLVLGIGVFSIFTTISVARFGKNKSIMQDFTTMRYAGEANLNFMALLYPDLKQPFYGYEDFALFRSMLFLDYTSTLAREKSDVFNSDIKEKMHYSNPTYIFHGTAGLFVFNFGKIGGVVAAFCFFLIFRVKTRKNSTISVLTILCILLFASNVLKGICYMELAGFDGNYSLLYLIILSMLLKRNGQTKYINYKQ